MEKLCCCIYCKEERPVKGIFVHVERTHLKSTKYSSGNNGKYAELSQRAKDAKEKEKNEYLKHPKKCLECDDELLFETHKRNKFCSHACSAKYNNRKRTENGWKRTEESKVKSRESIEKYRQQKNLPLTSKNLIKICSCCNKSFTAKTQKQLYCSNKCSREVRVKHSRENRAQILNYRADCQFKFGLKDFPNEFDFYLVEQYGWYRAKNRGNNLNGVSRDHMVSVMWGYENNIPAEHISHPANCRLILHSDNVSKGKKNVISYEELLERIKQWNEKYS